MNSPDSARDLGAIVGRASHPSAESYGNFRVWPQRWNTGCKETNGSLRRPRAQRVDWSWRGNRERSNSGTYAASNPDRLAISWRGRFGWGPSLRVVQQNCESWNVHSDFRRSWTQRLHCHRDRHRPQCWTRSHTGRFARHAYGSRWRSVAGHHGSGSPVDLSKRDLRGGVLAWSNYHHYSYSSRILWGPSGDSRRDCNLHA